MAEIPACLKIKEENGITTVGFTEPRLLEEIQISQVQQALDELVESKARPLIIIDLYKVEFFGSAALGMLVRINSRVKDRKGQMRVANIAPQVMEIFTLTKLDQVLRISATRSGAVNILSRLVEPESAESP